MKILQYLTIFSILLLAAQCRKIEIPEPVEGSPIFFLNTDLAGVERIWSAGKDSYYMHTSFEQDTSGLFLYSGSMEELGCVTSCLPAVKISFRGVKKGEALPDEYRDADGVQYSSAWGLQDGFNPEFELISVEPFDKNEDGLPTRKLEVAFRCQLFAEDGQPFGQFSGSGTIAVAIPE